MEAITTGFAIIDADGNIVTRSYGQTETQYAIYNNLRSARRVLRNLRVQLMAMGLKANEYQLRKIEIAVNIDD